MTPWEADTALGRSAVVLGLFARDEPVPVARATATAANLDAAASRRSPSGSGFVTG
jgi:hypothetical protein